MNETSLSCWAVLEENGEICCAHCNYMAGLGETCTHVAAMLFYLEAVVRMKGTRTCTQSQCAWVIPSYVKSVYYQPIKILTSHLPTHRKKRKFDEMIDDSSIDLPVCSSEEASPRNCVPQPTDEETSQLFEALNLDRNKTCNLVCYCSIFRSVCTKIFS